VQDSGHLPPLYINSARKEEEWSGRTLAQPDDSGPADVKLGRFDIMLPSTSRVAGMPTTDWSRQRQSRRRRRNGRMLASATGRAGHHQKNRSSTDDWNNDVCDVSIVREGVDRQTADDPHTLAAPLNNDDRELLTFYATRIDAHAADVDASTAEFYVDAYVCRSRFVVLTAHRLVHVGDVITRHVTNQSVGERIAVVANKL